jgi:ribosomal protein RSM22 (predicted rRNA methylase)
MQHPGTVQDYATDERTRDALVATAKAHGFPTVEDADRLGPMLEQLSVVYNSSDGKEAAKLLPARLAFSFPRDVPKGHAAVRELVATKALLPRSDRPLRILDVGAGLGAMTHGVVRALAATEEARAMGSFAVEALWLDTDRAALDLGLSLAQRLLPPQDTGPALTVHLDKSSAANAVRAKGPFDLVICGQVMSEMDAELPPDERVAHHAAWLTELGKLVAPDGSLVVVEPALAVRTRHLHAVRDAVLTSSKLGVFAPCLHGEPCPVLAGPHDWCHEDLPTDLPEWLVPLARAAGLRWQGLTFSYLVLRKDGKTLKAASDRSLRVTSSLLKSKGKTEVFLCGQDADGIGRGKARLLDREQRDSNAAFADAERGDLLSFEPALPRAGRIGPDTRVTRTRIR